MAGNVLQFALGLESASFLSGFQTAGQKVSSFASHALKVTGVALAFEGVTRSLEGMGNIVEGVTSAIERGAALEHLSKQTGESVKNLFLLQKGLKAVGLDSAGAGQLVFQLQKALGGVNEAGEPTAYVFGQLGLQIEDLKKMDAPNAIAAIAKKMDGLNNASATAAAGKMFRGGAREFLQLARSSKEFTQALKDNAAQAEQAQRTAAGFAKIELALGKLKTKTNGLFAGIAEGLAPTISSITEMLGKIDLTGLGNEIGRVTAGFIELFKAGTLGSFLVDSVRAAFDSLPGLALAGLQKLGAMLLRVFETPLEYFQAGMEKAIQEAMEAIGKIPGVGKAAGLSDFKADSWENILKSRKETGAEFFLPGNTTGQMSSDANKAWADAMAKLKQNFAPLVKQLETAGDKSIKAFQKTDEKKGGAGTDLGSPYRPAFTALEKLGFSRGGSIASDHARETARNTAAAIPLLKTIAAACATGPSNDKITNSHP